MYILIKIHMIILEYLLLIKLNKNKIYPFVHILQLFLLYIIEYRK